MNKHFLTYKKDEYTYFKPFKTKEDVLAFLSNDIQVLNYQRINWFNIVKYYIYTIAIKIFEKYKNLDFSQYVIYEDSQYNAYEMTDIYSLFKLLKKIKKEYSGQIVDIGCGKGLPFLIFDYFFEEMSGVDFNKTLCNIAKRNLKAMDLNVAISNKDIDKYHKEIDNSYIFMFNPFYGETMDNLISRIKGHNNIIVYHNPVCKDILVKNGFIELKSIRDILGFEIAVFKEV